MAEVEKMKIFTHNIQTDREVSGSIYACRG